MTEPYQLSLTAAARALATGALRPSTLLESCLERIADREPDVQAWELLDAEGARTVARAMDGQQPQGLLYGVPIGVKDIIDVAGLPTGCGSPLRSGRIAEDDAWVTAQVRAAGAVIVGKTVTTEFACFTPNKTRNPWDTQRTPGGSSSGSAAALASGMVPFAFATQTAGSTTRPASFCGVAGYVLPVGRYDRAGIAGLSARLDTPGLLTRTVADLAYARAALLGLATPPVLAPVTGPRMLLCVGAGFGAMEDSMRDAVVGAASALAEAGAVVHDFAPDESMLRLSRSHATIMAADAAVSLADERATGMLSPQLQELLDAGVATAKEEYDAAVEHARTERARLLALLEEHDAILAPAAPGQAPVGMPTGDPAFSRPWHVLGLPAVSIPGIRSPEGMPLGIQLIGHPDREERLLELAHWVESRLTVG